MAAPSFARAEARCDSTVNSSAAAQEASQGVVNASGGQKLVNTGAAIGGITAASLVLLIIGPAARDARQPCHLAIEYESLQLVASPFAQRARQRN